MVPSPVTSSCATAARAIMTAVGFWICISRRRTLPSLVSLMSVFLFCCLVVWFGGVEVERLRERGGRAARRGTTAAAADDKDNSTSFDSIKVVRFSDIRRLQDPGRFLNDAAASEDETRVEIVGGALVKSPYMFRKCSACKYQGT